MTPRIHFFPLADSEPTAFCGDFADGDGWTRFPQAVTCPDCKRHLSIAAVPSRATAPEAAKHPH